MAKKSWVYFLQSPCNGLIKIGYSAVHPEVRYRDLSATSPVPLERLGAISATIELERELHARFLPYRSHGEWFRPAPALLELIANQAQPWDLLPRAILRRMPTRTPEQKLLAWARRTKFMWLGETHAIEEWSKIKNIPLETFRQWADDGLRYDLFYYIEKQREREREGANLQPAD